MRVVSAHMVPKSGYVVNDGSTLPGLLEYNTASQRSFFQLLEKEVKLKSRKSFSRLPDAGGRGGLSDSHGQRQRRSVLIRD